MVPLINRRLTTQAAVALLTLGTWACGGGDKPTISTFTADPSTVDAGGTATLAWTVTDADKIVITDASSAVLLEGAQLEGTVTTGALATTTSFTLRASNAEGDVTRTVTVTVRGQQTMPIVDSFTAAPTTITAGESATLSWMTTNAESVNILAGGTAVRMDAPADGTFMVMPTATTVYTLVARDGAGQMAMAMVTVTVNAAPDMPEVVSFTAMPATIDLGAMSTLAWEVRNATGIRIVDSSNTEVTTSAMATGSFAVSPQATETYTITATGMNGSDTAMVMVTVNQPMLPAINSFTAMPASVDWGDSAVLAWDVSDADSIAITAGGAAVTTSMMGTGSFTVTPTVTTTYLLTATNGDGSNTAMTTVTVNAVAPRVSAFDAMPLIVRQGGMTTLSWSAVGASSVRVLRGTDVLLDSTTLVRTGTLAATVTGTSATFRLQAMNPAGMTTRSVTVLGQVDPMISAFAVVPMTFVGASITATVTWQTTGTMTGLTVNGTVAAGFPGTSTGSFALQLTANSTLELTATNAVGSASQSLFVAQLLSKLEPNNTASTAIPLPGNGGGVAGTITAGDEDWFVVNVPAGGNIWAETSDGMGGCPFDTTLTLTSTDGATQLVFDDDDGEGTCSLIDPSRDGGASRLPAGAYYLRVRAFSESTSGQYVLLVRVGSPFCGNGISREPGEQCDDGNMVGGDGCDSTCQIEPLATITGPGINQDVTGSIMPAAKVDFYQIVMRAEGYIRAETWSPRRPSCNVDTRVTLWDSNLVELGNDDSDGVNSCSRIDPQFDAWARVTPGTYWLSVEEDGNNSEIAAYELEIRTIGVGCGNGILETGGAVPETCDDGNTAPGDGCDAVCNFEGTPEGMGDNNTYNASGVLLLTPPVVVQGSIDPAGDSDYFAIDVPEGYHLDAYLTVGSLTNCPVNPEGRLRLYGTNGTTQLAADDFRGPDGNCGAINVNVDSDARAMPAGRYYLRVQEDFGAPMPLYYLHVRLLAPGCGNGVLEGTEICDDGNIMSGDGCSPMCTFDPATIYTAPGPRAVVNGSIDPETNIDPIRLVVTSTSYMRIESFTDFALGECTGSTDTRVRIYRADGTTEVGNDDSDGVGSCSLIDPRRDAFALLPPGDYFITIEEDGQNALIPNYDLVIDSAPYLVCGNGIIEANEACDDGNMTANDGCSPTCAFEPIVTWTAPGMPGLFANSIVPIGDIDPVQVIVTSTTYVRAETFVDSVSETCPTIDTRMRLFAADGRTQLGEDDFDGVASCSLFEPGVDPFTLLAPGTYWITVEEDGNNAEIANYELALTAVPYLQCGNGLVETGEFCDDGNMTSGDGCSATCAFEPLLTLTATIGTTATIAGSLAVGQVDAYTVVVTQTTYLYLETFTSAAARSCSSDTFLRVFNAQAEQLASDDLDGVNSCSLLERGRDPGMRLTPGTYVVTVEEDGRNTAVAGYELVLRADPADVCGDGIPEPASTEQCDDGNVTNGDGCSSMCALELLATLSVPADLPRTLTTSISAIGDLRTVRLDVTAPVYLRAQTFAPTAASGECNGDTLLALLNSEALATVTDDDGGVAPCSLLYPGPATRLEPGTWYVAIVGEAVMPSVELVLTASPLDTCGNGVIETVAGVAEQCDDGNGVGGDGCSSTCTFDAYSGPNPTRIAAALDPVGNIDSIDIVVTSTSYLTAETFNPAPGVCTQDTLIRLYDAAGTQIGSDDDDGVGLCSWITPTRDSWALLAPGNYRLTVEEYQNNAAIARYILDLSLTPAFVCGNGVRENAEACDDGNMTSGDGCSATCTLEITVVNEAEPNDDAASATPSGITGAGTQTVRGTIVAGGDADYWAVNVPAGATWTLRARTYDQGAPGNYGSCSFDSRIDVYDSSGTTSLGGNDDANGQRCSEVSSIALDNSGGTAAAPFYVRVRYWSTGGAPSDFDYQMDITVQ